MSVPMLLFFSLAYGFGLFVVAALGTLAWDDGATRAALACALLFPLCVAAVIQTANEAFRAEIEASGYVIERVDDGWRVGVEGPTPTPDWMEPNQ